MQNTADKTETNRQKCVIIFEVKSCYRQTQKSMNATECVVQYTCLLLFISMHVYGVA